MQFGTGTVLHRVSVQIHCYICTLLHMFKKLISPFLVHYRHVQELAQKLYFHPVDTVSGQTKSTQNRIKK